jgi:hypothetical protein
MAKHTTPMELYIEAAQVFHWATKRHFQLWFTGQSTTRHRRTETVLRRLTKRGKLRSVLYGKKLIYALPRKTKGFDELAGLGKVAHGLACTECLVRTYRSRMDGVAVAERFFYGLGSVPEWGILYPNGTMLLFEFCTKSNFFFSGNMKGKLQAYQRNIEKIEARFNTKAIVVFVIDVPKEVVERYAGSLESQAGSEEHFLSKSFFTDYKTFLNVPIGDQLKTPIYYWGFDGELYPLSQGETE